VAQNANTYNLSFSLKSFLTLKDLLVSDVKVTLGICFWENALMTLNNKNVNKIIFFMKKLNLNFSLFFTISVILNLNTDF